MLEQIVQRGDTDQDSLVIEDGNPAFFRKSLLFLTQRGEWLWNTPSGSAQKGRKFSDYFGRLLLREKMTATQRMALHMGSLFPPRIRHGI
jgi:hypothetical protein